MLFTMAIPNSSCVAETYSPSIYTTSPQGMQSMNNLPQNSMYAMPDANHNPNSHAIHPSQARPPETAESTQRRYETGFLWRCLKYMRLTSSSFSF